MQGRWDDPRQSARAADNPLVALKSVNGTASAYEVARGQNLAGWPGGKRPAIQRPARSIGLPVGGAAEDAPAARARENVVLVSPCWRHRKRRDGNGSAAGLR